jgi:hypothetical protein
MFVRILEESAMPYCKTDFRCGKYQLNEERTENKSRAFGKSCSSYAFKAAAQVSSSAFNEVAMVIPSVSR